MGSFLPTFCLPTLPGSPWNLSVMYSCLLGGLPVQIPPAAQKPHLIYVLRCLTPFFLRTGKLLGIPHGFSSAHSSSHNYCRVNFVIYYDFLLRLARSGSYGPKPQIVSCLVPKIMCWRLRAAVPFHPRPPSHFPPLFHSLFPDTTIIWRAICAPFMAAKYAT